MPWAVRFDRAAQKSLAKIPPRDRARIIAVIPTLAENPYLGKKLEGELRGLYSYRVWPYRIIYKPYKEILVVVIIRIGHRQGVY